MQRNNNRRVVQQWVGGKGRLSELAVVRGEPLLVGGGGGDDVVLGRWLRRVTRMSGGGCARGTGRAQLQRGKCRGRSRSWLTKFPTSAAKTSRTESSTMVGDSLTLALSTSPSG